MFSIKCFELTEETCDFVAEGETKEEVKESFYKHGEESPLHKEAYASATAEEVKSFGEKLEEQGFNFELGSKDLINGIKRMQDAFSYTIVES